MRVTPFGMTTEQIRDELAPLRSSLSIAIVRSKNAFNIGTMIRVAHSFLVNEIVLVGSDDWYRRAAMGMQKYERVVELPDEEALLAHARGKRLVGVERDAARRSLWEAPMPDDMMLVFGSENEGVPERILQACDDVIAIPMYGINHSYPVAVACGMVLCEWARRRDPRARLNETRET
jgi:tRNA G18 (ribose-2'-O)-methylase SpoU